MNCRVLVDGPRIAAWKLDCIALLRAAHHSVDVRQPSAARAATTPLDLLGGRALRMKEVEVETRAEPTPDLTIDLRSDAPAQEPAAAGALGYWYFCEGDGNLLGELPGARELAADSATFTIELQCRTPGGSITALRRGRFKSLYSYARTMDIALEECTRWPAICLSVFAVLGRLPFDGAREPAHEGAPFSRTRFVLRLLRVLLLHIYSYVFINVVWRVGLIRASPVAFLTEGYRPDIEWLDLPSQAFFADPFVCHFGSKTFVMGESLDPATHNGYISCVDVAYDGTGPARQTIMRSSGHLSYPYIFEHDGAWYIVPESAQAGCIELYRAVDAPYRWERVATLIDGISACDSTIFQYGGHWWLFCTNKSRDANLNLFAYYADDLFGPWHEHTANPIKTDIRSARPAGMPLFAGGKLYRPGQDCAVSYGDSIAFSRVTVLSEHEYREEIVSVYGNDGGGGSIFRSGTHTISYSGDWVAIDAKRTTLAPPHIILERLRALWLRLLTGCRAR